MNCKYTKDRKGNNATRVVQSNVDVQYPVPVNGDSIYADDVWVEESNTFNFSGDITNLFNNLHTVLEDVTAGSPKEILIHFNRTAPLFALGIGAYSGNFSNVKVIGLTTGATETVLYDNSSDNTKRQSQTVFLPSAGNNAIKLQFFTTDAVTLSNLFIFSATGTLSRIQGQKPNGDFIEFQATTSGNFKMSLEELENQISVNGNSQLKTTSFDSLGNEGQTIIGAKYISGKSGVDAIAEVQIAMDYEHHEIHDGNHFNYCDYDLNVSSGSVSKFVITTPSTAKWIHLAFEVGASNGATIELFEGTTGIVGGAAITPRNNNRNSATISGVAIVKDPTSITVDGVRASGYLAGGGKTAGATARDKEFVLKPDTAYLLRMTSLGVSNDISWCAEWYEHVSKN